MGVVYEAFDRERGTRVAVKTLRRADRRKDGAQRDDRVDGSRRSAALTAGCARFRA
jgi:hypothetical protein